MLKTCSKSTMKTPKQDEVCSKFAMKTPECRQWDPCQCFWCFFSWTYFIQFSGVSVVDRFERVNARLVKSNAIARSRVAGG